MQWPGQAQEYARRCADREYARQLRCRWRSVNSLPCGLASGIGRLTLQRY